MTEKQLAQVGRDGLPELVVGGPWHGHYLYRCAGCGFTHVSQHAGGEAPTHCRSCAYAGRRESRKEMAY